MESAAVVSMATLSFFSRFPKLRQADRKVAAQGRVGLEMHVHKG